MRVDAARVPSVVELCDQEDFTTFKVCVEAPPQAWVEPGTLAEVAGRSDDLAWQKKLAEMLSCAQAEGWLDDHVRVRAHVELSTNQET